LSVTSTTTTRRSATVSRLTARSSCSTAPDAELVIYPDANHGAHFQYPGRFVTHAKLFLDREDRSV
jgi:pimeloyl-ACP methyl ester carboxylesterase